MIAFPSYYKNNTSTGSSRDERRIDRARFDQRPSVDRSRERSANPVRLGRREPEITWLG